jgi:uncharacterized protein YbaR (Trm112 family)
MQPLPLGGYRTAEITIDKQAADHHVTPCRNNKTKGGFNPVPIHEEMLKILCCPVTKVPVKMLAEDKLKKLNDLIEEHKIKNAEGKQVERTLEEALITEDGKTIYRVDEGIPVMLDYEGIPGDQLN